MPLSVRSGTTLLSESFWASRRALRPSGSICCFCKAARSSVWRRPRALKKKRRRGRQPLLAPLPHYHPGQVASVVDRESETSCFSRNCSKAAAHWFGFCHTHSFCNMHSGGRQGRTLLLLLGRLSSSAQHSSTFKVRRFTLFVIPICHPCLHTHVAAMLELRNCLACTNSGIKSIAPKPFGVMCFITPSPFSISEMRYVIISPYCTPRGSFVTVPLLVRRPNRYLSGPEVLHSQLRLDVKDRKQMEVWVG